MTQFIKLYKDKGIEVLVANSPIDSYVMQFLERKITPATFQRVDSAVHDHMIDKDREKSVLDAEGKTEAAKLADFVRSKLGNEAIEVEAKSLAGDHIPGLVVIDENQRRLREYMMAMSPDEQKQDFLSLQKLTFVVNTNNKLLESIQKLDRKNPDLAKELVQEVYDLALLSQREMQPSQLNHFIERTGAIIEKLTQAAAE
jgi:molecular chaperone HtpG